MNSKILIDVDESGLPVIRIEKVNYHKSNADVRDKLVSRFLESGIFCTVSWDDSSALIHSMNSLDVIQNILDTYKKMINDSDKKKEFEQCLFKISSIIEDVAGERSTKFNDICRYQNL